MSTMNILLLLAIVILPIVGVWQGYRLADAKHNQNRLITQSDQDVRDRAICDEADMSECR